MALAAAGYAASPEDESNYSVQFGMFNYLPSFYASFNPTFGIIAGKAAMIRMARSATTRGALSNPGARGRLFVSRSGVSCGIAQGAGVIVTTCATKPLGVETVAAFTLWRGCWAVR